MGDDDLIAVTAQPNGQGRFGTHPAAQAVVDYEHVHILSAPETFG